MAIHQQIVATTARLALGFGARLFAALAKGLMSFPSMFRMREMKRRKKKKSLSFISCLFSGPCQNFWRGALPFFVCLYFSPHPSLWSTFGSAGPLQRLTQLVVFGCEASSRCRPYALCTARTKWSECCLKAWDRSPPPPPLLRALAWAL